jgi:hypothetical protein
MAEELKEFLMVQTGPSEWKAG